MTCSTPIAAPAPQLDSCLSQICQAACNNSPADIVQFDDAELATLLRLQSAIIDNGKYLHSHVPTPQVIEPLLANSSQAIRQAMTRIGNCDSPNHAAPFIAPLSLYAYAPRHRRKIQALMAHYATAAAQSCDLTWQAQQALLIAVATMAHRHRAYTRSDQLQIPGATAAHAIVHRWLDTLSPDGSWPGISLLEATSRAALINSYDIHSIFVPVPQLEGRAYARYIISPGTAPSHDTEAWCQATIARCQDIDNLEQHRVALDQHTALTLLDRADNRAQWHLIATAIVMLAAKT